MATSEPESPPAAKSTNSGEISYEYPQERLDWFLPKETITKC